MTRANAPGHRGLLVLVLTGMLSHGEVSEGVESGASFERFFKEGFLGIGLGYREKGYIGFGEGDIWASEWVRVIETEFDFEVRVCRRISVELDVRGEFESPDLQLQKCVVLFDMPEKQAIRLGNMKRRFGLEEPRGKASRITNRRSLLHDYISSFGFLGYDLAVEYGKKFTQGSREMARVWFQLGADAGLRVFAEAAARLERGVGRPGAGIVYMEHHEQNRENGVVANVNFERETGKLWFEAELSGGKDPNASYYRSLMKGSDAYFIGTRVFFARKFGTGSGPLTGVQPVIALVYLIREIPSSGSSLEVTPSLNLYFGCGDRVRWTSDVSLVYDIGSETGPMHLREMRFDTRFIVTW